MEMEDTEIQRHRQIAVQYYLIVNLFSLWHVTYYSLDLLVTTWLTVRLHVINTSKLWWYDPTSSTGPISSIGPATHDLHSFTTYFQKTDLEISCKEIITDHSFIIQLSSKGRNVWRSSPLHYNGFLSKWYDSQLGLKKEGKFKWKIIC